ncbi:unnamed protein product, partial [marine sediment metagenome]
AEKNIEIIIGVNGEIDEVVSRIVSGKLESGESTCVPGSGRGHGIEKSICDHDEHNHENNHKK